MKGRDEPVAVVDHDRVGPITPWAVHRALEALAGDLDWQPAR